MGLPEDDRRALQARLAPAGSGAADVVAAAFGEDEELREIVVDARGDVVAFTDRRALFVADGAADAVAVDYGEVEVRRRDAGLAIDALIQGGRLILDVARGTFIRLAVVGSGAPPGRASWLPVRKPPPRPDPEPPAPAPAADEAANAPPPPPGGATYLGEGRVPAPAAGAPKPPPPVPRRAPTVRPPSPAPAASTPPRPATAGPAPVPASAPGRPAPTPVPTTPPPGLPPAGWHPDPSGRHWWRWWDGLDWTDHVADGGGPFLDALPPRS